MATELATTYNYPITPTDHHINCYNPPQAHPVTTTLTPAQKRQLVKIARQHGHQIVDFDKFGFLGKRVDWKETFRRLEAALIADPALRAQVEQMLGGTLTLGKDTRNSDGIITSTDPTKADGAIRVVKPANDNCQPGPTPNPGIGNPYPAPILYPAPYPHQPNYPFPANTNNGFDQIANDFFTNILPPMDAKIQELERKSMDPNLSPTQQQAAQMELQKLVQRRSELIAMLSNLMKAVHDSQMAIIQNLRV